MVQRAVQCRPFTASLPVSGMGAHDRGTRWELKTRDCGRPRPAAARLTRQGDPSVRPGLCAGPCGDPWDGRALSVSRDQGVISKRGVGKSTESNLKAGTELQPCAAEEGKNSAAVRGRPEGVRRPGEEPTGAAHDRKPSSNTITVGRAAAEAKSQHRAHQASPAGPGVQLGPLTKVCPESQPALHETSFRQPGQWDSSCWIPSQCVQSRPTVCPRQARTLCVALS